MGALCQPCTSPQDIHGRGREEGLKPKLVAANVAGAAHVTGTHRLRYGPLHPSACGILSTKLRGPLLVAPLLKRPVRLFIGLENQHPRRTLRTMVMARTRLANGLREADSHHCFPMAIVNGAPALTGLRGRARNLVGLPINGELTMIKAHPFSRLPA